jgi:hypothetical protein
VVLSLRVAVAVVALALAAPALATPTVTAPVFDSQGRLIQTPFAPPAAKPHLTHARALALFERNDKIADWLARYPRKGRITEATYTPDPAKCTAGTLQGCWTVKIWWGKAGEIATGRVDDQTGAVTEAWTGPQVAWKMARGYKGAFGGEKINSKLVWLAFCAVFLAGLVDWRRPLSLRTLDLLALLSFSVSLWFFNHGNVFTSVPLVYPPLVYLLARCVWIGVRGRAPRGRPVWPAWVLVAATVFLVGFRIGLNVQSSNVIDVGYSGVIGADRIAHGQSPYGHFPEEDDLKACGAADAEGEIRDRIQTNGRCESANPQGDTYGPVAYEAYLPAYGAFGWSGKWDKLPTSHATTIAFDLLCLIGLALVGLRFGGVGLGATLAFAWAAYPFTQYVSNSNTNDAIMPAFLVWGMWLASSPWGRGIFAALAGWTKFAALIVAPLWLTYPGPLRRPRPQVLFAAAFLLATAAAFFVLFLEPNPVHAAHTFFKRTVRWQVSRESPFSLWDWRQYHAGLPDLHVLQHILQVLLVLGAFAVAFVPRRKSPLQLGALTAALLLGFELVLTYWIYLYIPWFFPFAAFAVLAWAPRPEPREEPELGDREIREPALAR